MDLGFWSFLFLTFGIQLIHYCSLCTVFTIYDLNPENHALSRYKIQETKNTPVKYDDILVCILQALINQCFVTLPSIAFSYFLFLYRGSNLDYTTFPSLSRFILDLASFLIVEEILFYHFHRLMHTSFFYSRIHKRHHQFTAPISLSALYSHPIEHALINLLPVLSGPILMASHIWTTWIWVVLVMTNAILVHSGYHLPFLISTRLHDFHHAQFNSNFGVLGVLDYLYGTDVDFRKSKEYEKDKILLHF